jgi:hypothetical protein
VTLFLSIGVALILPLNRNVFMRCVMTPYMWILTLSGLLLYLIGTELMECIESTKADKRKYQII